MKNSKLLNNTIIFVFLVYLSLPLLAILINSFSTEWYKTILPPAYTLNWYKELYSDTRFWQALLRSIITSTVPVAISIVCILLSVFAITVYAPRLRKTLQALVLLPYIFPGVILAISIVRVYSGILGNSVFLIIFAYSVLILPQAYQGIKNTFSSVNAIELLQACELLGATKTQGFFKVIVPTIMPGIKITCLLCFSILFGEFVIVNLVLGGSFETIQIMMYSMLKESGHISSALVISYFFIILLVTTIAMNFKIKSKRG